MNSYPLHFFTRRSALLFLALALVRCVAPGFDAVCVVPATGTPAQQAAAVCACQDGIAENYVAGYRRKKLDLLLVVGNTPGMAAKQQALAQTLAILPDSLAAADYDYHLGVVSTDVGSWVAADTPWTMSAGACDSFSGDDGQLQATSCRERKNVSAAAGSACAVLCPDRKFLPGDGRSYIARENGKTNVPSALEPDPRTGQLIDRGPEYALKCMALLGDAGCTISAPLESARRALDGHRRQNSGFLRPDSTLVVLFLTDADDCSVQPGRRADNDPHTQNCTAADPAAAASCYSLGPYRCLARDVTCDQPMNVAGAKTNCHERPDSALETTDTYVRFFAALQPYRMQTIGIWTLPALSSGGALVVEQDPKVGGSAGLVLGRGSQAGCQSADSPAITGSAQLRLSRFQAQLDRELGTSQSIFADSTNVCDTAAYSQAIWSLDAGNYRLGWLYSCLPGLPRLRPDGSPMCEVSSATFDSPKATSAVPMPLCGAGCCAEFANSAAGQPALDPAIQAACAAEPADCFCAQHSKFPGLCQGGARLSTWRKDNADAPPDSLVGFRCALQCPPA